MPLLLSGLGVLVGVEGCGGLIAKDAALKADAQDGGRDTGPPIGRGLAPYGEPSNDVDPYDVDPYDVDPYDVDPYDVDPYDVDPYDVR
jgi:hypothetical protein